MNDGLLEDGALYARYKRSLSRTYGDLVRSLPEGSAVLDLGCGSGNLLDWLSSYKNVDLTGVDSSPALVSEATRRFPSAKIVFDDGLAFLRKHDRVFGGIFCTDVLEHIPGDDHLFEWMKAARRALVPGGFFCCRVPNAASLTGTYSRYIDVTHVRLFSSYSLRQMFEAADFDDISMVPVHTGHVLGQIRLGMEALLHRAVFRICARGKESIFTANISAVARRPSQKDMHM
jgi:trans-aconitate methyltransferase